MGLKEKRAVQKVKDQQAGFDKKLSEAVGKDCSFDINWDGYMENEKAVIMIPNGLCARVIKGVAKICSDDLGKEAFQETLKKISVEHTEDHAEKSLTFDDGELRIVVALHASGKGMFTDTEYAKVIEASL